MIIFNTPIEGGIDLSGSRKASKVGLLPFVPWRHEGQIEGAFP